MPQSPMPCPYTSTEAVLEVHWSLYPLSQLWTTDLTNAGFAWLQATYPSLKVSARTLIAISWIYQYALQNIAPLWHASHSCLTWTQDLSSGVSRASMNSSLLRFTIGSSRSLKFDARIGAQRLVSQWLNGPIEIWTRSSKWRFGALGLAQWL